MNPGRSAVTTIRVRCGDTDAAGLVDGRPRWYLPISESGARFLSPVYDDDEIEVVSTRKDC